MSTLSEIAANLLKRERTAQGATAENAGQGAMGWEQLSALAREKDIHKWQATLTQLIASTPGQRRVTVMRVIQGGLS